MLKDELVEVIKGVLQDKYLPNGAKKWVLHGSTEMALNEISQAITDHLAKEGWVRRADIELSGGNILYMDLCRRLIGRILEFNPDEHDIELNLCGIIEKAEIALKGAELVKEGR